MATPPPLGLNGCQDDVDGSSLDLARVERFVAFAGSGEGAASASAAADVSGMSSSCCCTADEADILLERLNGVSAGGGPLSLWLLLVLAAAGFLFVDAVAPAAAAGIGCCSVGVSGMSGSIGVAAEADEAEMRFERLAGVGVSIAFAAAGSSALETSAAVLDLLFPAALGNGVSGLSSAGVFCTAAEAEILLERFIGVLVAAATAGALSLWLLLVLAAGFPFADAVAAGTSGMSGIGVTADEAEMRLERRTGVSVAFAAAAVGTLGVSSGAVG